MKLAKITKLSQWRRIHRLYMSAFPDCERKPFALIIYMYLKGGADIWALESDGELVGFTVTLKERDMVLIDYFAIAEDKRGLGFGSQALKLLQNLYRGKRLFLEIESVYEASENLGERIRRKNFYLRNNMTEIRVMVNVFGTPMELLGFSCTVNYAEYLSVYVNSMGKWTAKHLEQMEYPQ